MGTLLTVLIVEDSEDDAVLLLRALRGGGFAPDSRRVDTRKDMRAALRERRWDVILCDYRLPRFGAPAALELVTEEGVDAPVIVVSRIVKTADAVDLLKAGAHDFVEKDDIDRLVPAVERALRDAETHRQQRLAERALHQSEQRFRDFSEVASDWFWETDAQNRFNYHSKNVPGSVGPDWVPIMGKTRFDLRLADDTDDAKWEAHRADIEACRPFSNFEYYVRDADGTIRHARVSGKPLFDAEGTFLGYRGIGTDITERKRVDAELKRKIRELAEAEETAHVGRWRWIVGAGVVEWSDELYRMHGFEPGGFEVSLEQAIGFYHPDDREALQQYLDAAIEAKEGFAFELRLLPPDGVVRHIWARGECELGDDGAVVAMHGVVQDITERKKAERAMVDTVHAISATVEMRDPYTAGHQRRVAELSVAIGQELGLDSP